MLNKYDAITKFYLDINPNRYNIDRALYHLLKVNEDKINIENWIDNDPSGFSFHKSFRQTDPTGNWNMDMAIWHLMQNAPLFFRMLSDSIRDDFDDDIFTTKNPTPTNSKYTHCNQYQHSFKV